MKSRTIAIIGGGAAGFFAALVASEKNPSHRIIIFEKTRELLTKVRISGGGRCNVTHSCFDPKRLTQFYPRGHRELLGPFTKFQPQDTIDWFASKGVELKTEKDGRIFPITDHSETIVRCLLSEAEKNGIEIRTQSRIEHVEKGFTITLATNERVACDCILLASGGSSQGHLLAKMLGHQIISPVPSLFTFNVPASPLHDLSGISLQSVKLTLPDASLSETGPLLLTHFGFSGPAALRLSAWAARYFYEHQYQVPLLINWAPEFSIQERLLQWKKSDPQQILSSKNPFQIPKQLWKRFLEILNLSPDKMLAHLSQKEVDRLTNKLEYDLYQISGKTINKEEFVTAGGIDLREVNFKTMESRITKDLFFAGEVLNIDGITGGFNFQNAWTSGFLAGTAIANI